MNTNTNIPGVTMNPNSGFASGCPTQCQIPECLNQLTWKKSSGSPSSNPGVTPGGMPPSSYPGVTPGGMPPSSSPGVTPGGMPPSSSPGVTPGGMPPSSNPAAGLSSMGSDTFIGNNHPRYYR